MTNTFAAALAFIFAGSIFAGCPPPLPQGKTGIASHYPGDQNIGTDAQVIFADDFESYTSTSQLTLKWTGYGPQALVSLTTATGTYFSGRQALQFSVPPTSTEIINEIRKKITPYGGALFARVYTKFDVDYALSPPDHDGIRLSAGNLVTGGGGQENAYSVAIENQQIGPPSVPPGNSECYVYHPDQCTAYGDHWFPTGKIIPCGTGPAYFGPCFVSRPNFVPLLNRWYSYELMVQPNTPGVRDGRVAVWIDGNLIADWMHVRLRDYTTVATDQVMLKLQGVKVSKLTHKWYDNFVLAKSYIGPMQ